MMHPTTSFTGDDINIPALWDFVHETTADFHFSFAKTYVEDVSDLMDQAAFTDWQYKMDTAITAEFTVVERNVMQLYTSTNQAIVGAFSKEGLVMNHLRIMSMIA